MFPDPPLRPYWQCGNSSCCLHTNYTWGGTFPVGQELPSPINSTVLGLSNTIRVFVAPRVIKPPFDTKNKTVCLDWEPWFTEHNAGNWASNEGIPIVGKYNSFDPNVLKQHVIWMVDAGVNCILVDWSNNIWNQKHWADRGVYAQELINATTFMLDQYTLLRSQGLTTPSVVIMVGLDNGPSEPTTCLQEEIDWMEANYLANYSSSLFAQLHGEPVLVVLDTGGQGPSAQPPLHSSRYLIRYMGTQLQSNPRLASLGYWSWMDGSLSPVPAMVNGTAEALTVTPAFFAGGGWVAPPAVARHGGSTFTTEMQHARALLPEFLLICQWNEFAGQPNSAKAWVDSYNATLSNDMEPVSLTECGYRRPNDRTCGGWGFQPLNLIRATLALMFQAVSGQNILTIHTPVTLDTFSEKVISVSWVLFDQASTSVLYDLSVDGTHLASVSNVNSTLLHLPSALSSGLHTLTVKATSLVTSFNLSFVHTDALYPAAHTSPPEASVVFNYQQSLEDVDLEF
eukprot:m.33155 g.33155  ORF g.33155 m.33155 type:complete len:511 (-) comp15155_c0_seq1:25-1557(-)